VVEQRSSSLTIGERICTAFIPCLGMIEVLIFAMADCFECRPSPKKRGYGFEDVARLANETICNLSLALSLFGLIHVSFMRLE
jgi:serine/threonine-protein phosphatase 2B regulatory subunit